MPNTRKRQGTASEHQVIGQLIDAGIDVYQTVVDDQGIDAVLRIDSGSDKAQYFDLQIKSSRTWSGIRGRISALGKRENTVLILFNSTEHQCLWFVAGEIEKEFPKTDLEFGDVFLKKDRVDEFLRESRGRLEKLRERLEELKSSLC